MCSNRSESLCIPCLRDGRPPRLSAPLNRALSARHPVAPSPLRPSPGRPNFASTLPFPNPSSSCRLSLLPSVREATTARDHWHCLKLPARAKLAGPSRRPRTVRFMPTRPRELSSCASSWTRWANRVATTRTPELARRRPATLTRKRLRDPLPGLLRSPSPTWPLARSDQNVRVHSIPPWWRQLCCLGVWDARDERKR